MINYLTTLHMGIVGENQYLGAMLGPLKKRNAKDLKYSS